MTEVKKIFTLSFDDGVEQDKTIISLLRKYGVPASFNLNSSMFGEKGRVHYRNTESIGNGQRTNNTVDCSRIPENEIRQVYDGFEIATHAPKHEKLTELEDAEIKDLLEKDRISLQRYSNIPVTGHAYPYGATDRRIQNILKETGFLYARGVINTEGNGMERFSVPKNWLDIHPTCRQTDTDIEDLLEDFLSVRTEEKNLLFYMWGHSYEIDMPVMKERRFLYTFEKMLEKISSVDSVMLCTNAEAFRLLSEDA